MSTRSAISQSARSHRGYAERPAPGVDPDLYHAFLTSMTPNGRPFSIQPVRPTPVDPMRVEPTPIDPFQL